MRKICVTVSAAGFVASGLLHLLSFTPWARFAGERPVWALGALVFALTAAMVARLRRTAALGRRWRRVAVHDWRALVRAVPPGLRLLVLGAALYAWMNFALCLMLEPAPQDRAAIALRMASGHLIFFFLVPLLFFRFVEPDFEAARGVDERPHP